MPASFRFHSRRAVACLLALATPVRAQSAAGVPVRFTLTRFERVLATAIAKDQSIHAALDAKLS